MESEYALETLNFNALFTHVVALEDSITSAIRKGVINSILNALVSIIYEDTRSDTFYLLLYHSYRALLSIKHKTLNQQMHSYFIIIIIILLF
jgi:hypothetical protein